MADKKPRDVKIWVINGFTIHLEQYGSVIIIKDEYGNSMNISKKNQLSVILNLKGNYISS
jgi:hypothetical protein